MALDAKLEVLQDGAQKALMGGEEIASAANTMFQVWNTCMTPCGVRLETSSRRSRAQ